MKSFKPKEQGKANGVIKGEGGAQLEALLGTQKSAREALNQLRQASSKMPAGERFYDEFLAAGVKATCAKGAKLEALDLLYFTGAGRLGCVKELLAAGAPANEISIREIADCGVGGDGESYYPRYPHAVNGHGPWSASWRACMVELAGSGLSLRAQGDELPLMHNLSARVGEDHLEFAVSLGADVDARDELGRTVLLRAAATGNESLIERMLALGANPSALDHDGRGARDLAHERDQSFQKNRGKNSFAAKFDQIVAKWEHGEIERSAKPAASKPTGPRL